LRRIVVIDHGRVVHDGTIQALHQRYGSRRRVIAEFDEPWSGIIDLPGVNIEFDSGTRLIFAVDEVAPLLALLTKEPGLRDLSIAEPEIETVIAKLYQG
jgi:ABC-2 type transport system ATP-binding protein